MHRSTQRSGSHLAVAITACIVTAMVVAGGIAVAQPGLITGSDIANNSITGRDIRNNSVRSNDIRNNNLQSRDIRNGTILLEDLSDEVFQSFGEGFVPPVWVKIGAGSGSPTILSQNTSADAGGARDVTRLGTGQYLVEFTSAVRNCGWLATMNDSDSGVAGARMISVERDQPNNDRDLRVRTFDSDGTLADLQPDDAFTLQVLC